jgi:tetratricopeptide (TPR) repeat protein
VVLLPCLVGFALAVSDCPDGLWLSLGNATAAAGNHPLTRLIYKLGFHDRQDRVDYYIVWANTRAKSGNYRDALLYYDDAVEMAPHYRTAYRSRAVNYAKMGDLEKALADLNIALSNNSAYTRAYLDRSLIYQQLRDYNRALSDAHEAVALEPTRGLYRYNEALCYYSLNKFNDALKELTFIIDHGYVGAHRLRADVYDALGNHYLAELDRSKEANAKPEPPIF